MNDRREFLKKAGLLLGVGFTLPIISNVLNSCNSTVNPVGSITVKITDYPALSNIGGATSVTNAGFNQGARVIIVRTSSTTYNTYSGICPHAGCGVDPPSNNQILCNCHGSIFSTSNGSVLRGPARSGLPLLSNVFDNTTNILTITG